MVLVDTSRQPMDITPLLADIILLLVGISHLPVDTNTLHL
jgi:hypothetical protein